MLSIQATQTKDTKRVFKVRVGLDQNDSERMKMSGRFVKGPWRYEQIDGASHWIPLDVSDRLNQLLIERCRLRSMSVLDRLCSFIARKVS